MWSSETDAGYKMRRRSEDDEENLAWGDDAEDDEDDDADKDKDKDDDELEVEDPEVEEEEGDVAWEIDREEDKEEWD